MAQDLLRIVAKAKARPDKAGELRSLFLRILAPTRQEPGCLRYDVLQSREDSTEFMLVEEWTDEAAQEAHMGTDHIKEAVERLPNLLAEEVDARLYNLVG